MKGTYEEENLIGIKRRNDKIESWNERSFIEDESNSRSEEPIAEKEMHDKEFDWMGKKNRINACFSEELCKNQEKNRETSDLLH